MCGRGSLFKYYKQRMPPKKKAKKDPSLEKYEEELRSLADEQLRRALMDIGENPGPIDSSNR